MKETYKPHWAEKVLPNKRCWCLLKTDFYGCPYQVAQWDPLYLDGCWVTNETGEIITLEEAHNRIDWFMYLGDD